MLDLGRGAHVEFAVEALFVPPPHVFEGGELDLLDGAPRSALADEPGLVEPVHRLGEGIVEAVAEGPGRGFRAELGPDPQRSPGAQHEQVR